MSIGTEYAHDWFSLPPRCRTKAQLAIAIDAAVEKYRDELKELATEVRKFDIICIEDKYKMPAAWSNPAIKAKVILDKFEKGKL